MQSFPKYYNCESDDRGNIGENVIEGRMRSVRHSA